MWENGEYHGLGVYLDPIGMRYVNVMKKTPHCPTGISMNRAETCGGYPRLRLRLPSTHIISGSVLALALPAMYADVRVWHGRLGVRARACVCACVCTRLYDDIVVSI